LRASLRVLGASLTLAAAALAVPSILRREPAVFAIGRAT